MSVYTVLSREDLTRFIDRFDLGPLLRFEGITDGLTNTIYAVRTAAGDQILSLTESGIQGEALPLIARIMRHLAMRGIPVPEPIANRDGEHVQMLKGRPALLMSRLEGCQPDVIQPGHVAQVGGMLAELHRAGIDFPEQRPNPMNPHRWSHWINRMAPTLRSDAPDALALIESTLEQTAPLFEESGLPMGLCHADLFPDNTLFRTGALTGILDFDFACHAHLVYDMAITLNAWCFTAEGDADEALLNAFARGYLQVRPVQQAEIDAFPTACLAAALRFAASRLLDRCFPRAGSQVTVKDPEEYLQRIRFHQSNDLSALFTA
ncbi:MAG: homoserine kinase [Magnetococcales bacterium]|nr:homoserine kinase [Magnetococcales bacterium]